MKNPVLLIIAGPNGAGKTTVTVRLKKESWSENVEYLNPDDVTQERFGDWNSEEAVRNAAKWTTARREEHLAQRQGLAFETVFSAPDKIQFLETVTPSCVRARKMACCERSMPPYPSGLQTRRNRCRGIQSCAPSRVVAETLGAC